LDSVWSKGVRFQGVHAMLARYADLRLAEGGDASTDGAPELASAVQRAGGAKGFAAAVGSRPLSANRIDVLKSSAIIGAAQALLDSSVPTAAALRACTAEDLLPVEARWRQVPGQHSGVSWRYLRLLAGVQQVRPGRMIARFVADATGEHADPRTAATLVAGAAAQLHLDPRTLDHRIWRYQSHRL
jgi:hypothetical protein